MLGLYVHLPFCRVHCTYCPFAVSTDIAQQDAYVGALIREIASRAHGEEVTSVYFGGGTPSRTSIGNLERLTEELRRRFRIASDAEFTLEANPEDVDAVAIEAWRRLGVTRLSIGVQAFNDVELRAIGRLHDAESARRAVSLAVASGLRTSLDLIAGLPEQTPESFDRSLEETIALGVGHVSVYMLDLDETTPLRVQVDRGRTTVPEDDQVASAYKRAAARLEAAGIQQYEISNFAREGDESRHNRLYWERGEYEGFGLAAHSFRDERRRANSRNIREYIAAPERAMIFEEALGVEERRHERLFLALRQSRGIDCEELVRLSGEEGEAWIEQGLREGWLRRAGGRVAFTLSGFLLSNEYISALF